MKINPDSNGFTIKKTKNKDLNQMIKNKPLISYS